MQSDTLHDSLSRIRDYFVGNDDMYLRSEAPSKTDPVTALISCKVAPELEEGFQQWEMEAFRVEANAPGFIGYRLQRPVPGVQDDWIIELTFDSNSSLDRWLSSSERAALLKSGQEYQGDVRVRRGTYGFEFWARDASQPAPSTLWIFKSNLLALLVLYPTVYLWGYLISHPFIDTKGAPVWLSLFLGNAFSTQFLGFIAVPWIFKVFDFWLNGKLGEDKEPVGWLLILVLYALSMAGFAFILKLPPLSFG